VTNIGEQSEMELFKVPLLIFMYSVYNSGGCYEYPYFCIYSLCSLSLYL